MWTRKDLKSNGKKSLKLNYGRMIAVCFLLAILVGEYSSSTSFIYRYNSDNEVASVENNQKTANSDILDELITGTDDTSIDESKLFVVGLVDELVDTYTNSNSSIFSFMNTINTFVFDHALWVGILLLIGCILSVLFDIFVGCILRVGEKRFFMEARTYHGTKISRIFFLYNIRTIIQPAKIMVCKYIFNFLWWLTIIMGPVKHYEYLMVPYIIAENPKIDRKTAFQLSKEMMRGNKWNTFVLHLSFTGWWILNILTLNLLSIFFINPYIACTEAELYMSLRKEAITKKYENYELLNDPYLENPPDMTEC